MLSNIIKNENLYKTYLNKFLLPESSKNIDETKINFIKSIIWREKINLSYLWRYINYFDSSFNLTWNTTIDKKTQIDVSLPWLELYELIEILSFSSTRNLWVNFFNIKNKINFDKLNTTLKDIYFNNKQKWNLWNENPISLINILENEKGCLLLYAKRWDEVKYVDENQKFVSERKSSFFNIYISKWEKLFLSIWWVNKEKELKFITNYIKENLKIDIWGKLLFLDYHFDIFESNSLSITRKGELETLWKNEIQNKSSRNNTNSSVVVKPFNWNVNLIWWYVNIEWIKDLNIWFESKTHTFSIAKNNILTKEYINILEDFILNFYYWIIKEKTLYDIFKMKLTRREIISINEEEFFDEDEKIKLENENKYWIKFDLIWRYSCTCWAFNIVKKDDVWKITKCNKCSKEYDDFGKLNLNNFSLDINESYYNSLFWEKFSDSFNDKKEFEKIANFKKTIEWEEYNFIVRYSNEEDKRWIIKNSDLRIVNIFISPLVYTNESNDVFKIQCKSNNSIFIYFNLEIFEILKNNDKRNQLFENMIAYLKNSKDNNIIQYNGCTFNNTNKWDIFDWPITNSQIKTKESLQLA